MAKKKRLVLSLKKKWYDMIASGVKTEEYREIKPYWQKRLCSWVPRCEISCIEHCSVPKNFGQIPRYHDTVEFTLGYPSRDDRERRMEYEIQRIEVGYGNPEWGAPFDREVFIIKLGKRIK